MFSSIPGLCPLDASSNSTTGCDTKKPPNIAKCTLRGETETNKKTLEYDKLKTTKLNRKK